MERLIIRNLIEWKNSPKRKPLILRGVRQSGKTWILREFGKEEFEDVAYLSFENNKPLHYCFETDMNPKRIVSELGKYRGKVIIPGKTLVIFDEIQFCPKTLTSLKYFCEELPELHIVCAGSYLGLHLSKSAGSFPVGKVDFLTLHPMNFAEYLLANNDADLYQELKELTPADKVSAAFQFRLETRYKEYLITGGMPEAVKTWVDTQDTTETDRVLRSILDSYESDFLKYAPNDVLPKLTLIWKSIPEQLAKDNHKFIFSHVKTGLKSRDLEDALYWLVSAGIVIQISKIEKPGVPLSIYTDTTNFKIYLCDAGLLRMLSEFPAAGITSVSPVTADMRGALAENFVLTELLSQNDVLPSFWKDGAAEVEFIYQKELAIIPVEVKYGRNTASKSLASYRMQHHPEFSIRTSLKNISADVDEYGCKLQIPLYLLWNLDNLLECCMKNE